MQKEWREGPGKNYLDRGNNRQKHNARQFVAWKVKQGKLEKGPCEICGNPDAQFHHYKGYDLENRLAVQRLCPLHHREADKAMKKIG